MDTKMYMVSCMGVRSSFVSARKPLSHVSSLSSSSLRKMNWVAIAGAASLNWRWDSARGGLQDFLQRRRWLTSQQSTHNNTLSHTSPNGLSVTDGSGRQQAWKRKSDALHSWFRMLCTLQDELR
jgi:hypothetical protein